MTSVDKEWLKSVENVPIGNLTESEILEAIDLIGTKHDDAIIARLSQDAQTGNTFALAALKMDAEHGSSKSISAVKHLAEGGNNLASYVYQGDAIQRAVSAEAIKASRPHIKWWPIILGIIALAVLFPLLRSCALGASGITPGTIGYQGYSVAGIKLNWV
jgi:hypothetical protein